MVINVKMWDEKSLDSHFHDRQVHVETQRLMMTHDQGHTAKQNSSIWLATSMQISTKSVANNLWTDRLSLDTSQPWTDYAQTVVTEQRLFMHVPASAAVLLCLIPWAARWPKLFAALLPLVAVPDRTGISSATLSIAWSMAASSACCLITASSSSVWHQHCEQRQAC